MPLASRYTRKTTTIRGEISALILSVAASTPQFTAFDIMQRRPGSSFHSIGSALRYLRIQGRIRLVRRGTIGRPYQGEIGKGTTSAVYEAVTP